MGSGGHSTGGAQSLVLKLFPPHAEQCWEAAVINITVMAC